MEYWKTLKTDEGAEFDEEVFINADELDPFVTWGLTRDREYRCWVRFRTRLALKTPQIERVPSRR